MARKFVTFLLFSFLSVSCFSQKVKDSPIDSIQKEIVGEFSKMDSWMDCCQRIIDIGYESPYMKDCYKTDQNLVNDCSCQVWVYAYMENGLLYYQSYTDALFLNGLISLVVRVLNGHRPEEILNSKLYLVEAAGIDQHISPTRYRDLLQVILYMRQCAESYLKE